MASRPHASGEGLSGVFEELFGERARSGELLSKRSSLRVGGPADLWIEPHTVEELSRALELLAERDMTHQLIGLGSNTLFPDEGIRGAVIRLGGELAAWRVLEEREDQVMVEVGAGCVNAHLVRGLFGAGLVGAEFLMLIPGVFGGAVVMNAGTRDAELSSILTHIDLLLPGDTASSRHEAASFEIGYRHAALPKGAIVLGGVLTLARGDVDEARERAQQDKARRNLTQPYKLASVGSTFANPPGDFAGRLIEAAGLKGHRVGGARVSELHANFFINEGGATARDFLTLMALARVRVRHLFQIELRPEVQWVGFDGEAMLRALEAELLEAGALDEVVGHV